MTLLHLLAQATAAPEAVSGAAVAPSSAADPAAVASPTAAAATVVAPAAAPAGAAPAATAAAASAPAATSATAAPPSAMAAPAAAPSDFAPDTGWLLALILGFPLLMLLLEEALRWLRRHLPAFVPPLAILRNWTLPSLALYVLLVEVLQRPRTALGVRISETVVWITLILAALTLLNVVLFEGAPQGSWQAKVPKLFRDLGRFLLVLIGSAIVLSSVWGADLGGFLTALGVGSLVLGLALQDSLGNIFSGVALLFEQPIRMGDWVQIGESVGEVVEVNWRAVHLQTASQDLIVIPNAELSKGQFTNFNRPTPLHRVEIPVSFSYDDPPNRVRELLIAAANEIPGVLQKPPVDVVIHSYGDFAINYTVEIFAPDYELGEEDIRDQMNLRIWYLAKRHGLTMPYPIRQEMAYSPPAELSPEQRRGAILDLLHRTPGFASLSADRIDRLLTSSEQRSYAQEEVVLRQNVQLDGLYLILAGEAELLVPTAAGAPISVGVLEPGECFGEKSILLHGRCSDTMVRALRDLDVLVIPLDHLQELLLASPRLATDLNEVRELRRRAIEALPAANDPDGPAESLLPAASLGRAETS